MDYSKLNEIFKAKNITLKHFLKKNVGLTVNGFRLAQKNETLKVKDLEKISKALKLPMTYWWEEDPGSVFMGDQEPYELSDEERKMYQDVIKNLNKIIKESEERLARMEPKKRDGTSG